MLDKSLFPRLKRLFSTGVVIRNIGGAELKVSDPDQIQSFGILQTNSLIDRFTRLHKAGSRLQYNPTLNYQTLRLQLYSDYEAMDTDAFVAPALDVIVEDACGKGENGEVLSIKSSNENVQRILYNLFYNVLNIEFNLPMWTRSLLKYGDFYLKIDIAEKYGIYNVSPLSVYDIIREEGKDPHNPTYVCFRVDPTALAGGNAAQYDKQKFENYEVAHFRLISDTNYLPYGRSHMEPARKIWKQMILLEDAFLLHRITRAADKRIFYINIGNIPPSEVDNYMQQVIDKNKRTPYVDPNTGDYNLKFNAQNLIEDFYVPVRGANDTTTKIDTLKGLEYSGMDDVNYLRDKMFAALRVPKDRLNVTEDINGKATLAGIGVNFSKTIERIQRVLISELTKLAQIHLYVQEFDDDMNNFELRLHNPSIIYKQEQVALMKEQIDLYNLIRESNILSTDWFLDKVMEMSEDEILQQRELIAEDKKREFRYTQITEEGNDPTITGTSYGTPHDLATLYGQTRYAKPDVPKGYDEEEPAGRPKERMSTFGTDDSEFGRDPLGKKGRLEPYHPQKPKQQDQGFGVFQIDENINSKGHSKFFKKVVIFEEKIPEDNGILNENNIKSDENI